MSVSDAEHRVIVRAEQRGGPRAYCYCGWASKLDATYDEMVAELYAHLGRSTEPGAVARSSARAPEPAEEQPSLF